MFLMNALELSQAIQAGRLSVREAVGACIDLAEKNRHNAFLTVARDAALAQADTVQRQIDAGEVLSPLAGVPVALKDNISTAQLRTTCASKMLSGYIPVYDATVARKLRQAGMIVIGKLNMDEFAMGSSGRGASGQIYNPWDTSRVAGGSSGGSAAAVAACDVPLTLGSDTGGSIRQPCAFCGVTGIKPTYGAVSRYGLIAFASSLDQIGPIGRDINDCAAVLSLISGTDGKDSTCVIGEPFHFSSASPERLDGIKIGLPRNYFESGIDEDVKQLVLAAAAEFEAVGAGLEYFGMPLSDYVTNAYYIIACAEASSNLSRYDGLKYGHRSSGAETLPDVYRLSRSEGFGLEVKRRIMFGSLILSSEYYDTHYRKALRIRSLIKDAYRELFGRFDAILSPVVPTTAHEVCENADDPVEIYTGNTYTASVNLAGLPAVSLPCGFGTQGLPVGLQLIGDAFSESRLIDMARVYQNRTGWHKARPPAGGVSA